MAKRKPIILRSTDQVIEKLGGLEATAVLFGYAHKSGVSNWKARRIPRELHWLINRQLAPLGFEADPKLFNYEREIA